MRIRWEEVGLLPRSPVKEPPCQDDALSPEYNPEEEWANVCVINRLISVHPNEEGNERDELWENEEQPDHTRYHALEEWEDGDDNHDLMDEEHPRGRNRRRDRQLVRIGETLTEAHYYDGVRAEPQYFSSPKIDVSAELFVFLPEPVITLVSIMTNPGECYVNGEYCNSE